MKVLRLEENLLHLQQNSFFNRSLPRVQRHHGTKDVAAVDQLVFRAQRRLCCDELRPACFPLSNTSNDFS